MVVSMSNFFEINLRNLLYVIFLLMISRPQCLTKNHKNNKKAFKKNLESLMFNIGGVGGIRTHARDKPSNDLAILQLAIYTVFSVHLVQFIHLS